LFLINKPLKKIIFISYSFYVLFSSCAIDKRRYSRGYHVDFLAKGSVVEKKVQEKKANSLCVNQEMKDDLVVCAEENIAPDNDPDKNKAIFPILPKSKTFTLKRSVVSNEDQVILKRKKTNKKIVADDPPPEKKMSPQALTSLILGVISILATVVNFLVFSTDLWILFILTFPLTLALAIPAIILGAIATNKIKTSKGEIEGKEMGIVGTVFGVIAIIALVIIVGLMYSF